MSRQTTRRRHPPVTPRSSCSVRSSSTERPGRRRRGRPKQCLEYCAWILEHPGTTAQAMGAALAVAEGTRRSNMSRLRSWLGADDGDEPYLPDAYSGRIMLHPAVSSDWQRLQILTGRGVNRTSYERPRGGPPARPRGSARRCRAGPVALGRGVCAPT